MSGMTRLIDLHDEVKIRPGIAEIVENAVLCTIANNRAIPAAAEVIDLGSVVGEPLVKDGIGL